MRLKFDFFESVVVASMLTFGTYAVAQLFGWTHGSINWLEFAAVYTSYSCTWLCVGQRRINYPIGALSSGLYAVLFWQTGLVASAVLNGYLVVYLVYGWYRWRADANTLPVSRLPLVWIPAYLAATAAAYWVAVIVVESRGGHMALTDSVVLAATILAQFLLDNKKLETWFVWVIVNLFAMYTYASQGLWLAAFQFFFFLINTVIGYFEWRKTLAQSVHPDDGHAADHGSSAAHPVR
jgi:nicotinamide mononucleotide transporter